jgi:predicted small secreted protein
MTPSKNRTRRTSLAVAALVGVSLLLSACTPSGGAVERVSAARAYEQAVGRSASEVTCVDGDPQGRGAFEQHCKVVGTGAVRKYRVFSVYSSGSGRNLAEVNVYDSRDHLVLMCDFSRPSKSPDAKWTVLACTSR